MSKSKQRILLKITGEAFLSPSDQTPSATLLNKLITQIKQLADTHQFAFVVGGGNFFRGHTHGRLLGMTQPVAHQVGMLSTMMNGLILKDLCTQSGLPAVLFCAINCPQIGSSIAQNAIDDTLDKNHIPIFTGGTGNPFFTTDTSAVLRGLQITASQIWKGTKVDGIYSADPAKNRDAKRLPHVTYTQALEQQLGVMDSTALALAQTHNQLIRIFDVFSDNALIKAAHDATFGSSIKNSPK